MRREPIVVHRVVYGSESRDEVRRACIEIGLRYLDVSIDGMAIRISSAPQNAAEGAAMAFETPQELLIQSFQETE